jgi:hypothetical protein
VTTVATQRWGLTVPVAVLGLVLVVAVVGTVLAREMRPGQGVDAGQPERDVPVQPRLHGLRLDYLGSFLRGCYEGWVTWLDPAWLRRQLPCSPTRGCPQGSS